MEEKVGNFIELDWKAQEKEDEDFNRHRRKVLKQLMSDCAQEFEYPLAAGALDRDHENFKYFSLCFRNNAIMMPYLNNVKTIKQNLFGFNY